VGLFAPIDAQSKIIGDRVNARLAGDITQEFLSDPDLDIVYTKLKLSNGSFAKIHTAAPQSKIEGHSYHLIVVDEAQHVVEEKMVRCYEEKTPINMADGTIKPIRQVVEQKLNVLTPKNEITPKRWINTGKQKCYTFKLDNGREIKTTLRHKHLVYKKGWKKTRQMTTEEILNYKVTQHALRLGAPDILPYFGNYGNYNKGLLLGHFLGDGCVVSRAMFCGFAPTWKYLAEAALEEFDCEISWYRIQKESGLIEGYFKSRTTWRNQLARWFKSIGFWNVSGRNKIIPNLPFSKEFCVGLIQGLFETDGCVESYDVKPIISFANISEQLVRGLQDQLLKFGIHSRVFTRKQNGTFGKNPYDLWVLHIKDVESIKNFGSRIGLLTKQKKLEKALNTIKNKVGRNKCKYYDSNTRFQRIVNISEPFLAPTYCVEVPTEDHLIIANGIISGNSIHPMGAAFNGTIAKMGTPTDQNCEFYEAIKRNLSLISTAKKRNHFEFDYKTVQKYNIWNGCLIKVCVLPRKNLKIA
jgi:hypothetical protein